MVMQFRTFILRSRSGSSFQSQSHLALHMPEVLIGVAPANSSVLSPALGRRRVARQDRKPRRGFADTEFGLPTRSLRTGLGLAVNHALDLIGIPRANPTGDHLRRMQVGRTESIQTPQLHLNRRVLLVTAPIRAKAIAATRQKTAP